MDTRIKFFTVKVVSHWNRLPRKVVDASSLLKDRLGCFEQCGLMEGSLPRVVGLELNDL